MDLKGTKTESNLKVALSGECEATNKYLYYASQAKKDGYNKIAQIFEETSRNEMAHAKIWFKLLNGEIEMTEKNLSDAAKGENYEWTSMYKKFENEAKEEGFNDIALLFKKVGEIEAQHEQRYLELFQELKDNTVFNKDEEVEFRCLNCGYIHKDKNAPKICPVCNHPQSFFEVKSEKF